MAEIDDKVLAEYQGAYKIASALFANPETKDMVSAALKKLNPKAPLPEYDLKTGFEEKLKKLQDTIDGLVKGQKEKDESQDFQKRWTEAMQKHGITEEGEKKALELMTERRIADPEAGALLYTSMNPPQEPITSSPWASSTLFDPAPDGELADWFKNPDKKRDTEISATLAEFRNASR